MTPLLRLHGLTKRFGVLTALNNVGLEIYPGEIVGLAGRSGAGKTLLTRLLAGLQSPDSGQLMFNGRSLSWPFQAKKIGIGLIHQEPMLVDEFDITSNIFLGHELKWSFGDNQSNLLHQRKMHEEARRILALLDVEFPSLHEKVINLSSDMRQLISLAQGMASPAVLRIVDDPTSMLSSPYQTKLLSLIESWQQEGTAVLFSGQNLDHLFAVSDRIVVLCRGEITANVRTDETNREEIVAALVGTGERQQRTPVIWALDSYYQAKKQAETLYHNQLLLEQDLAARDSINQQLLTQLSEQVQALDSANLALQDAQRRLLTQRELERKHLSRELHDETIQDLLSLNYQLEEIASLVEDNEPLLAELEDARLNIRQLVTNVRGICGDLRPPTIDSLGLGAAIKSFTTSWSDRTGIDVALSLSENFGRLPETIELSIFRIVQEGLNNVWKHSGASQVQVTLAYTSPRMLSVGIADNGDGLPDDFDLSALSRSGHFGMLGIGERVALLGGRLSIQNQTAGGLNLIVEIPHPRAVLDDLS
ncbi:MAG: ATP-binding cassette domain-containing protein [Ardenticatenaceae bacterium]|nr:ATP-binding cassette domain-containing protein [Anaerolineales bacterium]MCB8920978.1 ATP-binding cassette domain-containing protein [Ardenticatenaceae bacterium]MCB8991598.1 ATP-binding cassette domain-containing protein [Ardenticatenaceae bacterium]MCB9004227.1 ATP-binding cassette domain-containing protein [Ardenticatenaceae bacterium]